jgi:hypothetical protein
MKSEYERELNKVYLHLEVPEFYQEDYKMRMLAQNELPALLDVTGYGMEGKSRYRYTVTGLASMKSQFEEIPLKKKDMYGFVNQLIDVVQLLKQYLLNPEELLLTPEFIFGKDGNWKFCYLPGHKRELSESFHMLTEFFVKQLDYDDFDGMMFAYDLHKATLQENYNLEELMQQYRIQEEERRGIEEVKRHLEEKEEISFVEDRREEEYAEKIDCETLCETKSKWGGWKKEAKRLRKKCVAGMKNFILESDGHLE